VRKALFITLVVVVLVTGLPVLMGAMSGMAQCQECSHAVVAMTCVLAVLAAGMALLVLLAGARLRVNDEVFRACRRLFLLERPPRLA